jgi:hypothetical protein
MAAPQLKIETTPEAMVFSLTGKAATEAAEAAGERDAKAAAEVEAVATADVEAAVTDALHSVEAATGTVQANQTQLAAAVKEVQEIRAALQTPVLDRTGDLGQELVRRDKSIRDQQEQNRTLQRQLENANERARNLKEELTKSKANLKEIEQQAVSAVAAAAAGAGISARDARAVAHELVEARKKEVVALKERIMEREKQRLARIVGVTLPARGAMTRDTEVADLTQLFIDGGLVGRGRSRLGSRRRDAVLRKEQIVKQVRARARDRLSRRA